jgi:hypothetical protein
MRQEARLGTDGDCVALLQKVRVKNSVEGIKEQVIVLHGLLSRLVVEEKDDACNQEDRQRRDRETVNEKCCASQADPPRGKGQNAQHDGDDKGSGSQRLQAPCGA